MPTILITGAANGLGAAFVKEYQSHPNTKILALDRLPISSEAIDLVVHSAGIRGLVPALEDQHPDDVAICETLTGMDLETITRTFQINTVATFALLRTLLPNLRLAKQPKVIVMSSRMGSLSNNALPNAAAGSAYAYRASKAALNMIVRSFAVDVPEVVFVLCHPGRVETKLVRGKEEGAIEAGQSVKGLVPLIDRWGGSDSGKYYDRFGETIEW
jgi:NAD(P)-dependent dehydrogenase (short-subunit alcohol dehydrogenase family)